jgi:superfamily II DNA or RNA helicase
VQECAGGDIAIGKKELSVINEERRVLQLEAIQALRANNFKGIVILPTGTGKSFVLIEALKELYKPGMHVLYTCDSTKLRDEGFNEEMAKWGAKDLLPLVERRCYAGAYKIEGRHFNILLADEGDYALTPEYSKIFFNNTFDYIIFVSATLDNKKKALAKKIAPIVYQKNVKEIDEKKIVNKSQFIIVPYLMNDAENKQYISYNRAMSNLLQQNRTPQIQKNLDFLTIQRSHFLSGLQSSAGICRRLMKELYEQDKNRKMLIFCGLNAQADKICKYSYHSQNEQLDNLKRFNDGEINALSVCGKVNRGINLNGVNTIILENCRRSETLMVQRIGRGKRLKIDDILYVYMLLPYYKRFGNNTPIPTIVNDWIKHAGRNVGIENAMFHYVK